MRNAYGGVLLVIIKHIPQIEKTVLGAHGKTALYQVFWQDEEKPKPMKSFTNFAKITLRPGGTNTLHTHSDIEQVYIVLRGNGTVQVGEEKADVRAGDAVFLPANMCHGFFNTGDKTTVIVLIGTRT